MLRDHSDFDSSLEGLRSFSNFKSSKNNQIRINLTYLNDVFTAKSYK